MEVKSDGLVLIHVEAAMPYYTKLSPEEREHYSCIARPSPPDGLLVLHMVNEYKRDTLGANHVLMGLAAGLYQRRALGFEDHFVFGTIHLEKIRLKVVAAAWENGKIVVYQLKVFDMRDTISMVQYYLLVRAINAIAREYCDAIDGRRTG
ncbi:hypothetical protein BDV93DRAFT_160708 [Ceratobasidium sp. AG-I]|nr:hypothetical protein BDV93DRAFT_160708 [Ceratobasidium sp. AG-I]